MSRLRQAIEGDVERKLYDGAVTQTWGPVSALYGPTSWTIPGHSTWITSSLDMTISKASYTAAAVTKLKPFEVDVTGIDIDLAALSLEAIGVSLEDTGTKLETTGVATGLTGVEVRLLGTSLVTTSEHSVAVGLVLMV